MGAAALLACSARRRLRIAVAFAALVVLAAPAVFGPALTPIARAIAAEIHVCQCGMRPGRCGCPECARLERERLRDARPDPVPTLKGQCDEQAPALGSAELPVTSPPAVREGLPAARSELLAVARAGIPPGRGLEAPPTPPPRAAAV
ncbi:MAG TPA: hypothetical protein VE987_22090 [Polyangiaceae bacterium]|nr:hypothetical protein [Polyangiaceae bacterium]